MEAAGTNKAKIESCWAKKSPGETETAGTNKAKIEI
jgi:hypothetical protein